MSWRTVRHSASAAGGFLHSAMHGYSDIIRVAAMLVHAREYVALFLLLKLQVQSNIHTKSAQYAANITSAEHSSAGGARQASVIFVYRCYCMYSTLALPLSLLLRSPPPLYATAVTAPPEPRQPGLHLADPGPNPPNPTSFRFRESGSRLGHSWPSDNGAFNCAQIVIASTQPVPTDLSLIRTCHSRINLSKRAAVVCSALPQPNVQTLAQKFVKTGRSTR